MASLLEYVLALNCIWKEDPFSWEKGVLFLKQGFSNIKLGLCLLWDEIPQSEDIDNIKICPINNIRRNSDLKEFS